MDNKDFKDKDCSEVYIFYHPLFKDKFNGKKYAIMLTKLYRIGLDLFKDSGFKDRWDEILIDVENSGSSDQALNEKAGSSTDYSSKWQQIEVFENYHHQGKNGEETKKQNIRR